MSVRASAWAWEQKIPSTAKFVLVALADNADDDGVCWPGQKFVADKTSFGRQTVNKTIAALENLKLIAVVRRFDALGRPRASIYRLCMKEGGNVADDDRDSRLKRQGYVADDDIEPSDRSVSRTILIAFDEFYTAYPHKQARPDAFKAWRQLNPSPNLALEITADVKVRFKDKEVGFIPYPATYLRKRRWEDPFDLPLINGHGPPQMERPELIPGNQNWNRMMEDKKKNE